MRLIFAPIAAFLLSTLVGCGGGYIEEAHEAFEQRDYARARKLFEVAHDDGLAPVDRFYFATAFARSGRPMKALDRLAELARSKDPVAGRALIEMTRVLVKLGDGRLIEEHLKPLLGTLADSPAHKTATALVAAQAMDWQRSELAKALQEAVGTQRRDEFLARFDLVAAAPDGAQVEDMPALLIDLERVSARDVTAIAEVADRYAKALSRALPALRAAAEADSNCFESRGHLSVIAARRQDVDAALRRAREVLAFEPQTVAEPERASILPPIRTLVARRALAVTLTLEDPSAGLAFGAEIYDSFGSSTQSRLRDNYCELMLRGERWEDLAELSVDWLLKKPGSTNGSFYRGAALFMLGEAEQAVDLLARAESVNPAALRHRVWLGRAYVQTGRFDQGISLIASARDLAPADVSLAIEAARLYMKVGDEEYAIEELESLYLRLRQQVQNGEDIEIEVVRAALLELWGTAVPEDAQEVLYLYPKAPENLLLTTRYIREQIALGERQHVFMALRRLRARYPEFAQTTAISLTAAHEFNDRETLASALEELTAETLDQLSPLERREAEVRKALIEERFEPAAELAREALEAHPTEDRFAALLVRALIHSDGPAAANGEAILLREDHPDSILLLLAAAEAAEKAGSRRKALEVLRIIIERRPTDLRSYGRAVTLATQVRDLDALRVLLPGFEEASSSQTWASQMLARGYIVLGEIDLAVEILTRLAVRAKDPADKAKFYTQVFELHHQQENYLQAAEVLSELRLAGHRDLSRRLLVAGALEKQAYKEALENAELLGDKELVEHVKTAHKEAGSDPRASMNAEALAALKEALAIVEAASDAENGTEARAAAMKVIRAFPYRADALRAVHGLLHSAATLSLRAEVERAIEIFAPSQRVKKPPPPDPKRRRSQS